MGPIFIFSRQVLKIKDLLYTLVNRSNTMKLQT